MIPEEPMIPEELVAAIHALDPDAALLVALDFDGTVSEIVAQPHLARPLPGVMAALTQLNDPPRTRVALLSGRARADLAKVSGAQEVAQLIGSHGQETGSAVTELTGPEQERLKLARHLAVTAAVNAPGALVEDKPAGFAVHVRNCDPALGADLLARIRSIALECDMPALEGKSVVELSVRPLDKGSALRALVAGLGHPAVVFAGDDVTDEAAMAVLAPSDVTIKVGPGASSARFRVPDPPAMQVVLELLARTRNPRRD